MPAHPKSEDFSERSAAFVAKIRRRYDELGWTQQQLIDRSGLSRTYVQMLLNNRGSTRDPQTGGYRPFNPTLDVIWILAETLELDIRELVDTPAPSGRDR